MSPRNSNIILKGKILCKLEVKQLKLLASIREILLVKRQHRLAPIKKNFTLDR